MKAPTAFRRWIWWAQAGGAWALSAQLLPPGCRLHRKSKGDGPMKPMIDALEKAFGALQLSTATIAQRA
jgi:hypothetical protein